MSDLRESYLHLGEDHAVREIPVGPTFWQQIGQRQDLQGGRLMVRFSFASDWPTWEIHPDGDEVVVLLGGRMTVVLEDGRRIELSEPGQTEVIPRGVWHTADVAEPTDAIFLTHGRGTQNKPR